jgi:hypothetical protein
MQGNHTLNCLVYVGPRGCNPPHELEKKAKATHQRMGLCVCVYQLMEAEVGDYVKMGL